MRVHGQVVLAVSTAIGLAAACMPSGNIRAQGSVSEELAEVVITAERRTTNLQTTAISATVFSGDDLASRQLTTINELQTAAPNFAVNDAGSYRPVNIRGIGTTVLNPQIVPGVAVFRDGLFQPETTGLSQPFYDIADTEILRGPQGTFIGANSTGGAVLISSRNPDFSGFNGFVEALVGNFDNTKLTGALNLPISDTWAARLAFNTEKRDSFYTNIGGGRVAAQATNAAIIQPGKVDDRNLRLGVLWQPNESFQALLKSEWNTSDSDGQPDQVNQNTFINFLGQPENASSYPYSTHQPFVINPDRTDLADVETAFRNSLELRYTLANGTVLRSLSGYQRSDIRQAVDGDGTTTPPGAPYSYIYQIIGPNNNYYSQEVNVISPDTGPLTWIGGASWFYRTTPLAGTFYLSPGPPGAPDPLALPLQQRTVTRTLGVFGQVSWQIIDTLQLQVGARENWDNNFGRNLSPPANAAYKDSTPTWKVGLNWTPIAGQYVYGFMARGYKSGGTNYNGPNFGPEKVTDYELGLKSTMRDGRVQTSFGAFYVNYEAYQQFIFFNNPTGPSGSNITNLPDSTIKGLEFSAQSRFGAMNVSVGAAYTDSALGSLTTVGSLQSLPPAVRFAPPGQAPSQCTGGATPPTCFDYTPFLVDISGEQNLYSPKLSGNVSFDYGIPLGGHTLRPRLGYTYMSKQYASLFQSDDFFLIPARGLWNGSVSYEADPWLVQAYANNIADKTYQTGYNTLGGAVYYGAPRQWGIRVSRTF